MLRMYKYIIYCSISAIIIIVSKYVYQNWIKQTHRINELQNTIITLQNKVKQLESEVDKFNISGGVKIPIVFKNVEKKQNSRTINFSQKESSTIPMKNNLDDLSLEESKNSYEEKQESTSSSIKVQSPKKPIKSMLDFGDENVDIDLDNISGISTIEKELEEKSEELGSVTKAHSPKPNSIQSEDFSEKLSKKSKEKKKKNSLPDAKTFNNGEKIVCEEKEYICVVGKRGGHSWKLLSNN